VNDAEPGNRICVNERQKIPDQKPCAPPREYLRTHVNA
jgi:hypothetical protein